MDQQTIIASGWTGAGLVVRQGPQMGASFPLSRAAVVVGREEGVGITIQDAEISRRHARVSWQDGRYTIEDLGSTNGTTLNGVPIGGPQRLTPGDVIGMGQTLFEFQWQVAAATPPVAQMPGQYGAPPSRPVPPPTVAPMPPLPPSIPMPPARERARTSTGLFVGCGCVVLLVLVAVAAVLIIMLVQPELLRPLQDFLNQQLGLQVDLTSPWF